MPWSEQSPTLCGRVFRVTEFVFEEIFSPPLDWTYPGSDFLSEEVHASCTLVMGRYISSY